MKIIIAPDSFKESVSAPEAAELIEAGMREVFPDADYHRLPVADGGEGTVAAIVADTGGEVKTFQVVGPLSEKIEAFYGVTGDRQTAVIEMAAASGLALVPAERRNPLKTTSYGTGELIRAALDEGLRHLVIGIGGSATNDAGVGMLQALGVSFLDRDGEEIGFGGEALAGLERIDTSHLDSRLQECRIEVACDVDNPLTGDQGASAVFGPQKGATTEMVATLDTNLVHFANLVRRDLQKEIADVPGAGAAGGMGAALLAFLNATLQPGVDIVLREIGLEAEIRDADLVITGEGRLDCQSARGKAPVGVARMADRFGIPVIAIAGSLGPDLENLQQQGIKAYFSITREPSSLQEALASTPENLRTTAKNIATLFKIGKNF